MKYTFPILILAASAAAAIAQTPAKPNIAAKPATTTTAASKSATTSSAASKPTIAAAKLPFGVPAPGLPPVKTLKKTAFSLQYQEIKVGTGAVAEPGKVYAIQYTGWLGKNGRADDGTVFDASDKHPASVVYDKDLKPVLDKDGKPEQALGQPFRFLQGGGRVIPGWDQGFDGMKIGGKRRLFIPWQLAYGAKGRPSNDPKATGIPAKSDLIFDLELVAVNDLPVQAPRPGMGGPGGRPMPPNMPPHPGAPGAPGAPGQPPAAGTPNVPAQPGAPAAATTPSAPAAPSAPAPPPPPPPAAAPAAPAAPAPATAQPK
jgi:peptidylprolyl isomerase